MTSAPAARRVLIVINQACDTAGGSLRAAVNVAETMARRGHATTFSAPIVTSDPHRTVEAMDERVTRRLFLASRPVARFGGSTRQFWWLVRNVASFDHVQVHSLFHLSAVYTIVLCALRRVPVVLWPHGTVDPFDLRKHARVKQVLGPLVVRRLLRRCAALVFTTEHESRVAVTFGAQTPHAVIPLPVERVDLLSGAASSFKARFDIPTDAPVVLFLGRINYKKGIPLLVEAVAGLQRADIHLVIVGDGEVDQVRAARNAARKYGVADRLRMTGWLEGEARTAAYAAADVFALLSDAENFGLALVEAMSAGVPAVISDQVFIADRLAAAEAALVVPRRADAATAALRRVLTDTVVAAELSARGRDYVAAHFAPDEVGPLLDALCT